MKIKLRGITIDPQKEPVKLIFETRQEIENISSSQESFTSEDEGSTGSVEHLLFSENFGETSENEDTGDIQDLSWKDRWIRSVAEFENYKKRIDRERADLSATARRSLSAINFLLEVESDLSQAKNSLTEDHFSGLRLIYEKLIKNLSSIGIEEISTESYDPDLHEVVAMNESGKSKIETVISKGWTMDEKPLRYPKVILNTNVTENE